MLEKRTISVFPCLVILVATASIICMPGCTGYRKVDGEWSYVTFDEGHGRRVRPVSRDLNSFAILVNRRYAKDNHNVFYKGSVVEEADASTFKVITENTGQSRADFGKDRNSVFIGAHSIVGADPETFSMVYGPYSRDANKWYCGSVPMEVLHPESFEVVHWTGTWGWDRDLRTFTTFPDDLKAAEAHLPAIVGHVWARDGSRYYYGPFPIRGADYESFTVIDDNYAVDKNRRYRGAVSE